MEEALSSRVVKGGFWSFMLRIIHQIFFLGRIVILARLLAPNDFGLMGLALLAMSFLDTFTQTGMFESLIQQKERSEEYLNAAWTFNVGRGLVLFAALSLLASPAARFFGNPEIRIIIHVLAVVVLFTGFANVGVMFFQKELNFKKQFLLQSSIPVTNFMVAVPIALIYKNVWALVIGVVAGHLVKFVVSYIIHPYRPRFEFNLNKIRELLGFGKWVLGSSMLLFFLLQGDDIFVGKLLGAAALGFYQMAYKLSNIPATEVAHVVSQVSFPAYAKLQSELDRLKRYYTQILKYTAFISFPVCALIALAAPEFVRFFLSDKWLPIVVPTQLLCIFGITRTLNATAHMVFLGMGKPRISTTGNLVQLILMALIIYPLTIKWGLIGAVIAVIVPNIVHLAYCIFRLKDFISISFKELGESIYLPFIFTGSMSLFILSSILILHGNMIILCFSIVVGVMFAMGITFKVDRKFYSGLKAWIRQVALK